MDELLAGTEVAGRRPASQGLGRRAKAALTLAVLAAVTAGCARQERGRRVEPPYQIGGATCIHALAAHGVQTVPWAGAPRVGSCRVDTPLRAAAGATARFSPALETSCAMLVALRDLEASIQEAARRHLGQRVRAIRHYGSYSCRNVNGRWGGNLSLHALGRAVDVSGFELADGRVVTVEDGWDGGSRGERRFLRAVRDAACRRYSVVLGPDSDRHHRDHLHFDIGPWKVCR